MWFSVMCTLINNDTLQHNDQNVVDSRGAAEWVHYKFWSLWWCVSLLIRVHTTLNHIQFVLLTQYRRQGEKSLSRFADNWKRQLKLESAGAASCKWATCTCQTFANSLNIQIYVREKSNDAFSLSIIVQTTINHFKIVFYHKINVKENFYDNCRIWRALIG